LKNRIKAFILAIVFLISGCMPKHLTGYGVFLGINASESAKLRKYSLVVIEPSEFNAAQIEKLHSEKKTVYAYLNIGAIEKYRPYYSRFKAVTLGAYENWPDELWINTASADWQDFIVNALGKQYADMGFDGFFLDNADVYFNYQQEEVFQGLCSILKGLKGYNLPLIINGGDAFVSRCIEEGSALSLFDGINQETVFTSIDFENRSYGLQKEAETDYYKEYLAKVKACGLSVYLLEYGADAALLKQIEAYCRKNGFVWYNAESLELK